MKNRKILTVFVALLTVILIVWGTISLAISFKYDVSTYGAGKKVLRHAALSTIYFLAQIYDPASTKKVNVEPENIKSNIDWKDYLRIEDQLNKSGAIKICSLRKIHNEQIKKSGFHFSYQPYEEPRLAELRKEYNLDEVVASAKDEFEAMVLLRNWTRSRFRRNDFQPYMENFDALTVLRGNIRNENNEAYQPDKYRPCHLFPLLYSQVMLSMGFQVRMVQISFQGGYGGHGMTEVWSNQYGKWVAMDPDTNAHFERDQIPLNMLEIHNQRYKKQPEIAIKHGIQTSGDESDNGDGGLSINKWIAYYSYIKIIDMRNDWMTNHYFRGHPKRSDNATLFWVDQEMPQTFDFFQKTDNINDFYWTLNQTEIWGEREFNQDKLHIPLAFKTFTPNFDYFEVSVDDSRKLSLTEPSYIWELHHGNNRLSVHSVNKFGIKGLQSFVEIFVN